MRLICVDDERLLMEDTLEICLQMPEISYAKGFVSAIEALKWVKSNPTDIALLDIDMPRINGLQLAARIKETSPETAIIFITGYSQYAVGAFAIRASGYLLKPVSKELLYDEIKYIMTRKPLKNDGHITVKTFGVFDVYKDGKPIKFKTAKSKELLAYLVDRQGGGVTRAEVSSVLWEDRIYDRKQQKITDVYIRSLKETLSEYGISEILEIKGGVLRVLPEKFTCDVYQFFAGDTDAVNAYRGVYMSSYSWASITEGIMYNKYS